MKPIFTHDCNSCTFLGVHIDDHGRYDLYFCTQGGNLPTIIARYSDNGPDYTSGIAGQTWHPAIVEGTEMAHRRGLL